MKYAAILFLVAAVIALVPRVDVDTFILSAVIATLGGGIFWYARERAQK